MQPQTPHPIPLAEPPAECDVVIVGAGIVGLATARELAMRHDGLRIAVLERDERIGTHQTGRSSGVIHAGVYYVPGSLKAELCVKGMRELYEYCDERGIPAKRSGKLIVASTEAALGRLDELERRGEANGVEGLRRISGDEIAEIEPHARGVAALHSPNTGVVDYVRVAGSYAGEMGELGGTVSVSCPVISMDESGHSIAVSHAQGVTRARAAVLCAGAWSDRLAVAAGAPRDPRIVPFRGGYLRLKPHRAHLVRSNVYPVPDPDLPFLGAHLTKGHDGEVLLGPTALMVAARDAYRVGKLSPRDLAQTMSWPGTWKLMAKHWRAGATEMRHAVSPRSLVAEAQRYVPELEPGDFEPGPAGIRAQALGRDGKLVDDFVVSRTERAVHVRNAPSPAATSSLAIARLIADEADSMLTD
ncbi:L-2-hydroxyglutarate oxidase [soil metagenome]